MCPTNDRVADTEDFSLKYPSFEEERSYLARAFSLLQPLGYMSPSNQAATQLILYDDKDVSICVAKDSST